MTEEARLEKERNWFERLQFYTKDFTKEETIKLVRHVTWVKVEGLVKEQNEIENLIEKDESLKSDSK